jgi:tetratricopeptide (TPR) repeat protein
VWQPTFRRGDLSFDATTNQVVARAGARCSAIAYGDLKGVVLGDREDMLAWTLTGLEADKYFIGVVTGPDAAYRNVYLNGRAIQFDAGGEVLQDQRGASRLREWVTGAAVALRNGDQIRVNGGAEVVRLNLYRSAPPRGMINVERATAIPDFYRFDATLTATGGVLEGRYALRNAHGRPDTVTLKAQVVDYEQRILWDRTETIALQPFEQREFTLRTPGSATWLYRLKLQATGAEGQEQFWTVSCMPDVTEGLRPRLWLSGNAWEVAAQSNNQKRLEYADARKPAVKHVVVPGPWPQAFAKTFEHVAWYRREFSLEPEAGRRYVLHFDQLLVRGEIYVNGRKAGDHFAPYTPFDVEITPFVRRGVNVLEVGITDPVATLPEATLDKMPTGEAVSFWSLSNWLDAPRMGNVPQMGDVYLETRPMVHAADVRVICDYPKRQVDVRFRVNARGPARRVRVGHQVFHAGKPVLTIPERDVDLPADGAVELDMSARWANPVLWQMEDPRLCVLVTTVRDDAGVLDEARTRFGFAHWRTEGHRLLLNGTPQKLRFGFLNGNGTDLGYARGHASLSAAAELDYAKRYGGINGYRDTPSARMLRYADEVGFVSRCQITGLWNPTGANLIHEPYWKNAERFGAGAARALGNHPSIAFWEASNEFACFAYYQDLTNGFDLACERLWGVHQAILRERPDRLVESDSDGDLNGLAQSVNFHYTLDSHVSSLIGGKSFYYPDSAFWHPLDRPPVMGELLPAGEYKFRLDIAGRKGKIKWGDKMVGTGETCWSAQYNGHFGLATVGGDKVYEDEVAVTEAGMHGVGRYPMGGQRDIEMGYIFYWHHYFGWWHKTILPAIGVVPLEYHTRFVGGERARRRFNLHNDTEATRKLTVDLVWIADGIEQRLASKSETLGPAGIARLEVAFKVPRVKTVTRGQLAWRVKEGRITHWDDPVPAAIWPSAPIAGPVSGVYAYDPASALGAVVDTLGARIPVVTGLPPAGATGLLVAPGALAQLAAVVTRDALRERLAAGLKLVVLAQSQLPRDWLPVTPEVDATRRSSIAFARDPGHPALAGVTSDDLRFWAGDHLVSAVDYVRPQRGNWRVVVDSGSGNGLDIAPMLELCEGHGRVILCQMPLLEKAAREPAAAQLLANLVAYAGTGKASAPAACVLVSRPDSALAQAAARLNIRADAFAPTAAPPAALPVVVLVDAGIPLSADWVEVLKRHAREGGTVHLGGVRPETKTAAEAISGRSLLVYPLRDPWAFYGPYYGGRVVKRRDSAPLLAGVSNHELCWVGRAASGGNCFTTRELIKADILDYECRPAVAEEESASLVYPHALLDFPVGKGRVIVNQLRWASTVGEVQDRADRLAVALLSNLGVRLDPPKPRLVMPDGVRAEPMDLRPYMNLALKDETAGDGLGGWSDQGARFDMRNLPTGVRTSEGVPFEILAGEKACLVIGDRRPMKPANPDSMAFPVGRKLAGAWFLHSMAWGAGQGLENYQFAMEYEDGSREALKIVTGLNATDWSNPLPHTFRDGSRRAWTAFTTHSEGFPQVSVFAVEWVNPQPDRIVRAIRFEPLDRGVVSILLGITLALPGPASATAEPPLKAAAEAMTAAEQERCRVLREAGRTDELVSELMGIVTKAPAKVDARKLLAFTLWKERRDYDGAEAQYLEALKVAGETADTLNKLGELNEQRKAFAKALQYYQRSLKTEWNQPPTMDAVQRVQAAIAQGGTR